MIQQNATASLSGTLSAYGVTFPNSCGAGNTILVALTCSPDAFGPVPFIDSHGNSTSPTATAISTFRSSTSYCLAANSSSASLLRPGP